MFLFGLFLAELHQIQQVVSGSGLNQRLCGIHVAQNTGQSDNRHSSIFKEAQFYGMLHNVHNQLPRPLAGEELLTKLLFLRVVELLLNPLRNPLAELSN
jgi:hypothetical protein